ncbi:Rv3654c family TadE-like protein [Intrasporangium sp. DVR]|uniref:Rv3654c family TadE-like protein n=1 Tax=Intrasporangium sp. DVR TaxID=3127867 RepID=UPI00313A6501
MRCAATSRRAGGERGAATVLVIGVIVALMAATLGGLLVAGAVVASHRARLAADLAALAGATLLRDAGTVEGSCSRAARVAAANGGALVACRAEGLALAVVVTVPAPGWPEPARARSKAGPPSAD